MKLARNDSPVAHAYFVFIVFFNLKANILLFLVKNYFENYRESCIPVMTNTKKYTLC